MATPAIEEVLRAYPKQVKLIFKEFPLEMHPQAPLAASAALAAFKQNKFWEMHDLLFANGSRLSRTNILGFANQLGLDMKRFESDLNSTEIHETVLREHAGWRKSRCGRHATLFLNGQKYNGPISVQALKVGTEPKFNIPVLPASS